MMASTEVVIDRPSGRRFVTFNVRFARRYVWAVAASLSACRALAWLINRLGVVEVDVVNIDTPVQSPCVDEALRTLARAVRTSAPAPGVTTVEIEVT